MLNFLILPFILLIPLTGCEYYQPAVNQLSETKQIIIQENSELKSAAQAIEKSIRDLKALEKSARPNRNVKPFSQLDKVKMFEIITLDWVGELEPLLKSIAQQFNYRLRTIGKEPIMPLIVSISAQRVPLIDIIRNAHVQAGTQADIFVYPQERIIELRYVS